jgi:hypothetical protein
MIECSPVIPFGAARRENLVMNGHQFTRFPIPSFIGGAGRQKALRQSRAEQTKEAGKSRSSTSVHSKHHYGTRTAIKFEPGRARRYRFAPILSVGIPPRTGCSHTLARHNVCNFILAGRRHERKQSGIDRTDSPVRKTAFAVNSHRRFPGLPGRIAWNLFIITPQHKLCKSLSRPTHAIHTATAKLIRNSDRYSFVLSFAKSSKRKDSPRCRRVHFAPIRRQSRPPVSPHDRRFPAAQSASSATPGSTKRSMLPGDCTSPRVRSAATSAFILVLEIRPLRSKKPLLRKKS